MAARATAFEENTYNLWNDVRYLDKEGIIRLRLQLSAAARESGAKIEHLLHQHYPAFISASKVSCHTFHLLCSRYHVLKGKSIQIRDVGMQHCES